MPYAPAYVGIVTLDLSKVLMFKFHYDYIKNKYGNNSILLFTGTKTEYIYEDLSKDTETFYFRNDSNI